MTAERTVNLGFVGVSGALGTEIAALLRSERFPLGEVKLFGGAGSAGDVHELGGTQHVVRRFTPEALEGLDVVVLATPAEVSRKIAAAILAQGVAVVDVSTAARDEPDYPLLAPPVNRAALEAVTGFVASPGAFSLAIAHVLANLPDGRLPVALEATGLASSAALGRKGMATLSSQVLAVLNGRAFDTPVYPRQIAFDVVPWVGETSEGDGNPMSPEERRVTVELERLFPALEARPGITLAQTPVFCGHSLSLRLDFAEPCPLDAVVQAFEAAPALALKTGAGPEEVPSVLDSAERPEVLVGRLRSSEGDRVLRLWLSFDNLRVAARNVLFILESLRDEALI